MADGVTYADLRFVRSPPLEKTGQQGTEGQGELTYENVKGPRPSEGEETPKESKGSKPWVKRAIALGLLATCLFLLATAVGLGVRYWQVSGQLRWSSQDHTDHTSVLEQRVNAQDQSLAQMEVQLRQAKMDLSSTRAALRKSLAVTEMTQKHLEKVEGQLRDANRTLEALKWEKDKMEARLCQQIGCCPPRWTLFRWKCLWVSQETKPWEESQEDCEERGSRLVILKEPWDDPWGLEEALGRLNFLPSNRYWIGLSQTKEKSKWVFRWADGSRYEGTLEKPIRSLNCVKADQGKLVQDDCSNDHGFICERPASSMRTDPDPRPF